MSNDPSLAALPALTCPARPPQAHGFLEVTALAATSARPYIPKMLDKPIQTRIAETALDRPIDAGTRIGHVHLKVADLDRALAFYCGVLGFDLMQRYGESAAFVSAGGYHHHIGLNTWESKGGPPPAPGTTGLYHIAILYPTRAALADALRRLVKAGVPLDGASDHGVSEALYLRDPDQNGVELYRDRPQADWPRTPDGGLAMVTKRLDLEDLLRA
jgi:catechol 2,3-dioxygenase